MLVEKFENLQKLTKLPQIEEEVESRGELAVEEQKVQEKMLMEEKEKKGCWILRWGGAPLLGRLLWILESCMFDI